MCIPQSVLDIRPSARQRLDKHVSAATNTHATTEKLFDASFSMRSMSYKRKVGDQFFPEPVRKLHISSQVPYIYDYITKLCRQQAEVIQNYENANVCDIGTGEARQRKYKRLNLGGGQAYDRSSD
jgi:hypothetical protein